MNKFKLFVRLLLLVALVAIPEFIKAQNCSVNANIDQTICSNQTMTLIGATSGLLGNGGVTTWTQVSGPSVIITTPNSLTTTVTGFTGGNTYTFRLNATCEDGELTGDNVNYSVNPVNTANAGADFIGCPGTYSLAGNTPSGGQTGTWTIVSGSGVTINSPNNPTSTITITAPVSCASSDDVTVTNLGGVSPVSAGPDQTLSNCYSTTQSTSMNGTSAGDGTGGQIGTWTVVSGPNVPTIANANSNTTSVSNLIAGTYVFRWTVTGPCASGSDLVTIIVPPPTSSVTSASGSSQTFCDGRTSAVLVGNNPLYGGETVLWVQTSGPACTIVSPSSPVTTVTGLNGSSNYSFTYTIANLSTGCNTSGSHTINYNTQPALTISNPAQTLACGDSVATINYTLVGGNSVSYQIISGPFTTGPTSTSTTSTTLTLGQQGTYVIRFTGSGGTNCNNAFADATVIVSKPPSASNPGSTQILACNVTSTALVGNVPFVGTGLWTQISGPSTVTLTNPDSNIVNISGLLSGLYRFRWTITGGPNCPVRFGNVQVVVSAFTPTTPNAGPDVNICSNSPIILQANVPVQRNESGIWTVTPSAGVTITSPGSATTLVSGLSSNTTYNFVWTMSNTCASLRDTVIVITSNTTGPAASNAGPDQCRTSGTTSVTMAGNAPSPAGTTGLWSQFSGPNTATITTPTSATTTMTGLVNGTYLFIWRLTKAPCTNSTVDTVYITIGGNATSANAGPDQSICGTSTVLAGNTITTGIGTWSQDAGGTTATFSNANSPTATVSNLDAGAYTFIWTSTNGACSGSNDTVQINVQTGPSAANAGSNINVCGASSVTLNATAPVNGSGVWSVVGSSPSNPNFVSVTSPNTFVSNLAQGTYTFRWTVTTGGSCSPSFDDVTVTVVPNANAGADQSLCFANSTTLTGNVASTGTWALVSGPNVPTITTTASNTAIASGLITGVYVFSYTIAASGGCPTTSDNVTVTISSSASAANAGIDQSLCNDFSYSLSGNIPGAGTVAWTQVFGPTGGSFTGANTANATFNTLAGQYGLFVFEYTITNGSCSSTDQIRVENFQTPTTANAGTNITTCPPSVALNGNNPTVGVGTWAQVSGPNSSTINNPILYNTTVSNLTQGTYIYSWTITNGVCPSSTDNVSVNVPFLAPTTANAGADVNLCNIFSRVMAGNTPVIGTGTWALVSGPNSPSFSNVNNPSCTISGLIAGTYVFSWTIANGTCTSTDQVTVNIYALPTVSNAGSNQSICLFQPVITAANTALVGTGTWSQVSGPSTALFVNPNNPATQVLGLNAGVYVFRWSIANGVCVTSTDDVQFTIIANPTTANAGPNQSICFTGNAATTSTTLAGSTVTTGSGSWAQVSGPSAATISTPSSPTSNITNLSVGTYTLTWTTTNLICTSRDTMQLIVKPKPVLTNGLTTTVCGGSLASVTLSTTPVLAGNTYTWTAQVGVAPAGGSLGGFSNQSTPTAGGISQTPTNNGTSLGTIYYLVTPINNGCSGDIDTVFVNVNPRPSIAAITGQTFCSGSATNFVLNTSPVIAGSTFTWTQSITTTPTSGTVTGQSNQGSGVSGPIAQTLTNTGTSPGVVTYVITATGPPALGSCTSPTSNVTATVNPIPSVSSASTKSICSGSSVAYTPTSAVASTTFSWTASLTSGTITGIVASGSGTINTILTNTGTTNGTVTYVITPTGPAATNCVGAAFNLVVTVNPTPTVSAAGSDQALCNATSTILAANTPVSGTGAWSVISGPNVPTFSNAADPAATLSGMIPGTYVLRWTISSGVCTASTDNINIINSPTPSAASAGDVSSCDIGNATITATPPAFGTGAWSFISGPNTPTITTPSSASTTVTGLILGTYVFRWTVSSGVCSVNTDDMSLTVANCPPVALDDIEFTLEDTPITSTVIPNDSDPENDTLVFTLLSNPSNGTVVFNIDGTYTYSPDTNFNGIDIFTYYVCDPFGLCDTADVVINISPGNDGPVAIDDIDSTLEDTPVTGTVATNDYDLDGDTLIFTLLTSTSNGTITFNNDGTYTYIPNTNFTGQDTLVYYVCDPNPLCDTAIVIITVISGNDPPVAIDDSVSTNEDTPVTGTVAPNDFDVDNDSLTFTVITGVTNGTIIFNNDGTYTYTPDTNFTGTDTLTYIVCDDGLPSLCDTGILVLTVNPLNDPPVAVVDVATTNEDTPVSISILSNDFDPDVNIDTLSITTILNPLNGTVSLDTLTGVLTYTPNTNFNGIDSLIYEVCDTGNPVYCDTAIVYINVTPVNDSLVAVVDTATTNEDTPITITILVNDVDIDNNIDSTSVTIILNPPNGTVTVDPLTGVITYTPNTNFNGVDSLIYNVCDLGSPLYCDTAIVYINVNPANDPPVAVVDVATTNEDTPVSIPLLPNDFDLEANIDTLSITITLNPTNGTVTLDTLTGVITYTPNTNFNGVDSLIYELCDTGNPVYCDTAIVYITVTDVADPVIANVDTASTLQGDPVVIDILNNDTDIDNDINPGSVTIISTTTNGTITVDSITGVITYNPDPGFSGVDSLIYQVCDSAVPPNCDTAIVYINVISTNAPLIANQNDVTTSPNTAITINILGNDTDPDNNIDSTSVTIIDPPNHGTVLVFFNGAILYTPVNGFIGIDSLIYQVCDLGNPVYCDTAYVIITISTGTINNPPVGVADFAALCQNGETISVDVIANDTDSDGNMLNLMVVQPPAYGTATISGDSIIYTPNGLFFGVDSVEYTVCDATLCDTAYLVVTLNPAPVMTAIVTSSPCNSTVAQLAASGANSYSWSPAYGLNNTQIPNPVATPDSSQTYTVTGTNAFGCVASASVDVVFTDCIEIPDAFTPDGDGQNDVFQIVGIDDFPNNYVRIYNRWGNIVYEKQGYTNINGWDGTSNGKWTFGGDKVPAGTYYYIIDPGNGSNSYTGYVVIKY
jgi:gliding motility-associated-like protein